MTESNWSLCEKCIWGLKLEEPETDGPQCALTHTIGHTGILLGTQLGLGDMEYDKNSDFGKYCDFGVDEAICPHYRHLSILPL